MKIIGMDLGTSNTYLYGVPHLPGAGLPPGAAQPAPIVVSGMSDDNGSIATVVLYENGKPLLAGNIAEGEFYSNLTAQPIRRLASQFKPEISQGAPDAMGAMRDFLYILRASIPDGILETDTCLYVGMPSLAKEDFSINLASCFADAGWPRPVFVRESDAALISCLQSGTLDIDDMERKCLIVDFGGGTCDYTTVENMDVLQNGGDILYGGRLFDDLVYELFQRHDAEFAAMGGDSPYSWFVHWIECKEEKEKFSDFLGKAHVVEETSGTADNDTDDKESHAGLSLHVLWYDMSGGRHDAFVHNYGKDAFVRDAENYAASPEMLHVLAGYGQKGGISAQARDLLAGREVGLISWFRTILESIGQRRDVRRVVLTGGSSRWPFVGDLVARLFPEAACVHSRRSYEDIAFGLALFPMLAASREKVSRLLNEKIGEFALKAVQTAKYLMQKQTASIVSLCSERIVSRDVMPALEAAQKSSLTVAGLEQSFARNIREDSGLVKIAEEKSALLREEIQTELNFAFRRWLRDNGVLLVPNFTFPAQAIGQEFFNNISVKISRLDSLQLMKFTLTTIVPILVGTSTAVAMAHTGEPVSSIVGGSLAFGTTWLLARTTPKVLEKRKLPSFLLTESNRKKIVEKNRTYIEKELTRAFGEAQERMEDEIERRLKNALDSMLGRLTVLNQIKTF